jgi:RimJ/RimL family protein N-acetyltransferase
VSELRLETARLTLRMPRLDDSEAAVEMLGDPEVMRFLGGRTVPAEEVPVVVGKWIERWELHGVGPFVVERRTDGHFLGRTGILVWDTRSWEHAEPGELEHAQPELGWAYARGAWGNGYATEAAGAVRDWVRQERGVDRLISLIVPTNARSRGVAERLGAVPTETVTLHGTDDAVVWVHV